MITRQEILINATCINGDNLKITCKNVWQDKTRIFIHDKQIIDTEIHTYNIYITTGGFKY